MEHAFEVPQLLHDPKLASAMRTTPLNFNVVVKNAHLCLRLWCSSKKQMRQFDDLCRYMTERRLFVQLIVAIERYLEPESLVADFDCSSDSTFSDDDAGPSAEVPKLAPESADAELLEEPGTSSASPYARWERAVAESEERWKDIQAFMERRHGGSHQA
eukprot:3832635-Pleurochrysis_carterae.AAC.2